MADTHSLESDDVDPVFQHGTIRRIPVGVGGGHDGIPTCKPENAGAADHRQLTARGLVPPEEGDRASVELPCGEEEVGNLQSRRDFHVGEGIEPLHAADLGGVELRPLRQLVVGDGDQAEHGWGFVSDGGGGDGERGGARAACDVLDEDVERR